MTHIEDRLRATLRQEAARVHKPRNARAENDRRLRARTRFRLTPAPVVAAASVLVISIGLFAARQLPERAGPDKETAVPASGLPANLDPRYRPTGPVVRVAPHSGGYGKSVLMWQATGGLVCWRQNTGGGGCGTPRELSAPQQVCGVPSGSAQRVCRSLPQSGGRHGHPAGVFAALGEAHTPQAGHNSYVYYGAADAQVASVSLITPSGQWLPGTVTGHRGLSSRLWQVGMPSDRAEHMDWTKATLVFHDANGRELERISRPGLGPDQLPAPQTRGVPLFTYDTDSKVVEAGGTPSPGPSRHTLYARVDGGVADFISPDVSGWSSSLLPERLALGSTEFDTRVYGAPWFYGFVRRDVAKVVYRLADGRLAPARVVDVGGLRAYSVRLPDDRNGKFPRHGDVVIAYDANGNKLGQRSV